MRALIIAAAGTARRFNKDLTQETAKCLFFRESPTDTLLFQLCAKAASCDAIVIVGGYQYDALIRFVQDYMGKESFLENKKIVTVFNPHYEDYGSAYSLIMGVGAAAALSPDEIVFAEGDLFFDGRDFAAVIQAEQDVLTITAEPIRAAQSVVFYEREDGSFRYIYDTDHKLLTISEPFRAVYNSGQVWKFTSVERLERVIARLSAQQQAGTNLEIINGYFSEKTADETEIVLLNGWINCNTVHDYDRAFGIVKQEE